MTEARVDLFNRVKSWVKTYGPLHLLETSGRLGHGQSAQVYSVNLTGPLSGVTIARKRYAINTKDTKAYDEMVSDMRTDMNIARLVTTLVLKGCSPHFPVCFGVLDTADTVGDTVSPVGPKPHTTYSSVSYMHMEKCTMNLFEYIKTRASKFTESQVYNLLFQIFHAIVALHVRARAVHFDTKTENILCDPINPKTVYAYNVHGVQTTMEMSAGVVCKLTDFNIATSIDDPDLEEYPNVFFDVDKPGVCSPIEKCDNLVHPGKLTYKGKHLHPVATDYIYVLRGFVTCMDKMGLPQDHIVEMLEALVVNPVKNAQESLEFFNMFQRDHRFARTCVHNPSSPPDASFTF